MNDNSTVEIFKPYFYEYTKLFTYSTINNINKLLYIPRARKDNFAGNDNAQRYMMQDSIKELVINKTGTIIDTYDINNLYLQYSIVNSSKIIIQDYGGGIFVNCVPFSDKIFIIFDIHNCFEFHKQFEFIKIWYEYILQTNKYYCVNSIEQINELLLHYNNEFL